MENILWREHWVLNGSNRLLALVVGYPRVAGVFSGGKCGGEVRRQPAEWGLSRTLTYIRRLEALLLYAATFGCHQPRRFGLCFV